MKNRGGGVFSFLFGKRMTSAEKRQCSAEIRHERLSRLPGTRENVERQQKRREQQLYGNRSSPHTRKKRKSSLPGTEENIRRQREKASTTSGSALRTRRSRS